jgi:aromatase
MTRPTTRAPDVQHMVHSRQVAADPAVVYDLVADVGRWPVLFGPTLHVEVLERTARDERFRLWALVGGEARAWTSRRELDPDERRIEFVQERTQAPIASMGGTWRFRPEPGGTTRVELEHSFRASGDDPGTVADLRAAVDRNSEDELGALARLAELGQPLDDLVFAFDDVVHLPVPPGEAYAFVHDAERWPERLPHVGRVEVRTPQPDVQEMEMETLTSDGQRHTTRSIRLCFPEELIVYKQLGPPTLLLGHSGAWRFAPGDDGGAAVTARHMVAVDPAMVETVLGPDSTLADAHRYLRDALGANSRATLARAGQAP